MRIREIIVIFLSFFIVMGGLAIPLWWNFAAPILYNLPARFAELSRSIENLISLVFNTILG